MFFTDAAILGRGEECVRMKMWVWMVILSVCYVMTGKYFTFVNAIPSLSSVFFLELLRSAVTSHFLDC